MTNIKDFPETNEYSAIDFGFPEVHYVPEMKKEPMPEKIALRPTPEDHAIFQKLRAKLGVDNSQIIRLAVRRLLEAEGLRA